MQLTLIKNPDESKITLYKTARVIYAETGASSLAAVEALASMISNISNSSARDIADIVSDDNIFQCLRKNSSNHKLLSIDSNNSKFQMCLRVVRRMLNGNLPDSCLGAVRFHRANMLPDWAVARGYITDIDGLLFYL